MDKLVYGWREFSEAGAGFAGWTGINTPGELERASGIWVTKAGARRFPKGFRYNPNDGDHWEWGALLDGGIRMQYGSSRCTVREGSSYLMASDIILTADPIGNPLIVWVEFSGPNAPAAAERLGGRRSALSPGKYSAGQVESVLRIAKLLHGHPAGCELAVHALFWAFLSDSIAPAADGRISPGILRSLEFIDRNLSSNAVDLPALARACGMPVETFRKRFRAEVGESPIQYLLKARIKRAKEHLSCRGMSIRQIARETGFENQYYFSRLFKKYESMSPREYQKRFYP